MSSSSALVTSGWESGGNVGRQSGKIRRPRTRGRGGPGGGAGGPGNGRLGAAGRRGPGQNGAGSFNCVPCCVQMTDPAEDPKGENRVASRHSENSAHATATNDVHPGFRLAPAGTAPVWCSQRRRTRASLAIRPFSTTAPRKKGRQRDRLRRKRRATRTTPPGVSPAPSPRKPPRPHDGSSRSADRRGGCRLSSPSPGARVRVQVRVLPSARQWGQRPDHLGELGRSSLVSCNHPGQVTSFNEP